LTGGASFCEVFFTDARVPLENVIGGVNEGWAAALTTLANERVNLGAGGAGGFGSIAPAGRRAAEALQEPVGEFVKRAQERAAAAGGGGGRGRGRGGRGGRGDMMTGLATSLGRNTDPVIRQQVAQLYTLQKLNQWNGMRAKAAVASGQRPGPENSIGKLMTSHITRASRDLGMAILQARGMLSGADAPLNGAITAQFLSSPAPSIYGGSDQIQRNIIGERVLALPKEPDPSADLPFRELKVGTQRSPEFGD
jgi:alkylation response protein AidB-like acyl-CoA dehydrogenase